MSVDLEYLDINKSICLEFYMSRYIDVCMLVCSDIWSYICLDLCSEVLEWGQKGEELMEYLVS